MVSKIKLDEFVYHSKAREKGYLLCTDKYTSSLHAARAISKNRMRMQSFMVNFFGDDKTNYVNLYTIRMLAKRAINGINA